MIEVDRLRVSLTKNGYLKIAELLKRHSRYEILDHLDGSYPGINLVRSQVVNILGMNPTTEEIPEFWDEIREYGDRAIDCFAFVAIVLSHWRLISALRFATQGDMHGHLKRDDLTPKEYTNLVYAMHAIRLCDYRRGAESVNYDLYRLVYHLQPAGHLVRKLIRSKLLRCGWREPKEFPNSDNPGFLVACHELGIPEVFGLEHEQFEDWLNGELEIEEREEADFPPSLL